MSRLTSTCSVAVQTPEVLPSQGMQPAGVLFGLVPPVQGAGGGGLQVPAWQEKPPATLQGLPHMPQFALSVFVFVHAVPQTALSPAAQQVLPTRTSVPGQA